MQDALKTIVSPSGALIIVGTLAFTMLMFPKGLAVELKNRVFKAKVGQAEVEVGNRIDPVVSKQALPPEEVVPKDTVRPELPETDPQRALYQALADGDRDAYDIHKAEVLNAIQDPRERCKQEAQIIFLSYLLADWPVLDELRRLQKLDPTIADIPESIGAVLRQAKNYDEAEHAYRQAIDLSESPQDRNRRRLELAQMLREAGRYRSAASELEGLAAQVESTEDNTQRFEVYHEWGELLLAQNLIEEAQRLFEKALSFQPENVAVRFNIAYRYHVKLDKPELAFYHYVVCHRLDEHEKAVLSNLGNLYTELGMPMKGVDLLKRAAEKGHGLAMASVADQLRKSGCRQEAREWLDRAFAADDKYSYVGTVLSQMEDAADAEQARESELLIGIERQREDLSAIIEQ